jgi:CDP-4-dehydro-6-deoxyglucose reductase
MAGLVRLQPSDHQFPVDGNDSMLEAALQAGLPLNYGCSNGNCGLCQARLLSGEVSKISHHDFVFTEAEKSMGHILLCSYTAVGDVLIEAQESAVIPEQHITTRVKKLTPLTGDIVLLHLQTPRTQRLRFLAGQSVRLHLDDKTSATHPIASCPCDDRNIQFHIRLIADDAFSQRIESLKPTSTVQVMGPFGDFTLNNRSDRSILFLAFHTGFAPVKSLIEHAMQLEQSENLHLYWIADGEENHYMHNLVRSWIDVFDNFSYTPLNAKDLYPQAHPAGGFQPDSWNDVSQKLLRQVNAEHEKLSDYDIYVAGPDPVSRVARDFLAQSDFPEEQFKSMSTQ